MINTVALSEVWIVSICCWVFFKTLQQGLTEKSEPWSVNSCGPLGEGRQGRACFINTTCVYCHQAAWVCITHTNHLQHSTRSKGYHSPLTPSPDHFSHSFITRYCFIYFPSFDRFYCGWIQDPFLLVPMATNGLRIVKKMGEIVWWLDVCSLFTGES